ncbi:MAG: hypothetical protein CENE_03306 [Candidatus Celerinatantimonas neptuna]|nr:MAG: hypothetical protein CENE_03306 [Candidatus Celerinatantimonas neptuna]
MTLDDVLLSAKLAMPRNNVSALCRELGVSRVTYYKWENWRDSGTFPSEDNIFKLASIGNTPLNEAVFALMAEKSKNPDISNVYRGYAGQPALN